MYLPVGTQLGRYKITALAGEGGMGEVYLAEDTTLERRIALKILPPQLAQDGERMARFVREAKSASALNHPNIAHIYEIGESGGVHFIAMEFVEGVSLREKIHGERADLKSLLKYLIQVAEGLAKAHAAGIAHRDLKPDNVMVSADGYAKVLDFGLAKLVEPRRAAGAADPEGMNEAATAVMPQPLSTPGMIMGTVGYMSPEQAQGRRELDQRSDIFSFGCILYEAATRRQPFAAETVVDSLHKIIHAQPTPVRELNADAPADLQRIVRRCLQKDPEERYQTIKDVAIELRELRREMESAAQVEPSTPPHLTADPRPPRTAAAAATGGNGAGASTAAPAARSTSSAEYLIGEVKKRRSWAVALVALLALVLAATGYGLYRWAARGDATPLSFQSAKFTRLTATGKVIGVSLSPDGRYVAHVIDDGGQQSLWVRQTAAPSDVQIVPPAAGASYRGFTFSPDGNFVYYTVSERDDRRGTLYQVPVLGGTSRKLLSGINSGVSFSPDGRRIAYFRRAYLKEGREDSLLVANADGTGERTLAKAEREIRLFRGPSFSSPAWSPDGRTIACPYGNTAENNSTVAAVSVETGEIRPLTPQRWFAVRQVEWLAGGGRLLFTAMEHSAGAPYQIWQLDPATGEARRVSNDLINYRMFSLTADSGALAVVHGESESNVWVMPASDSARAAQITSGTGLIGELTWTPDGGIIYNTRTGDGVDLYLMDPRGGGGPKRLTADSGSNSYPQVTRDGRYVVFMSDRTGRPHVWRMDSDGGNQKQLTDGYDLHPHVSPDGRWVVYQSWVGKNTLRKAPVDGGQFVQLTDYVSGRPAFSPDGRQIACSVQEDGGSTLIQIAVIAAEGGPPLKTFPLPGEGQSDSNALRWTADGREIVYAYTDKGVSNLWAQPVGGGRPRQITNFTSGRIFWFDFSHDGKQIALSRGTQTGDVVLIKEFR